MAPKRPSILSVRAAKAIEKISPTWSENGEKYSLITATEELNAHLLASTSNVLCEVSCDRMVECLYFEEKAVDEVTSSEVADTSLISGIEIIEFPYECAKCKEVFTNANTLERHMLTHPWFVCGECYRKFEFVENLIRHAVFHKKAKNYTCHLCSKAFILKARFVNHMVRHAKNEPHVCNTCHKSFITRRELNRHRASQNYRRNRQCLHCKEKFKSSMYLKIHIFFRHELDGPYVCDHCKMTFESALKLQRHSC